jgi:hypothetical protein
MHHYNPRGLSEAQASKYLGISRSSLRQGRMDGVRHNRMPPPPFVQLGRKIIYLIDDLDQWLEQHRTSHCSAQSTSILITSMQPSSTSPAGDEPPMPNPSTDGARGARSAVERTIRRKGSRSEQTTGKPLVRSAINGF